MFIIMQTQETQQENKLTIIVEHLMKLCDEVFYIEQCEHSREQRQKSKATGEQGDLKNSCCSNLLLILSSMLASIELELLFPIRNANGIR